MGIIISALTAAQSVVKKLNQGHDIVPQWQDWYLLIFQGILLPPKSLELRWGLMREFLKSLF